MWRDKISSKNPMRIFEKGIHGGLGKGNLGVFIARSGVGKTACLIHLSLDTLFQGNKVLHFAIGQRIEDVKDWYDEIFEDLVRSYNMTHPAQIKEEIAAGRIILTYTDNLFDSERMQKGLHRIEEHGGFHPDVVFIDGLSFETMPRAEIEKVKTIASDNHLEVWFAAKTHREGYKVNSRGIPAPCDLFDDLLSVIVFLEPLEESVRLRLLKDHDNTNLQDLHLLLDPSTLMIKDEVVEEMR